MTDKSSRAGYNANKPGFRQPKQLTNFQGDLIFNFAWSHDGNWLALARGTATADVILIEDQR
jgi:hypothetical protein